MGGETAIGSSGVDGLLELKYLWKNKRVGHLKWDLKWDLRREELLVKVQEF